MNQLAGEGQNWRHFFAQLEATNHCTLRVCAIHIFCTVKQPTLLHGHLEAASSLGWRICAGCGHVGWVCYHVRTLRKVGHLGPG